MVISLYILYLGSTGSSSASSKVARKSKKKKNVLEKALYSCHTVKRENGLPISGKILRKKARELFEDPPLTIIKSWRELLDHECWGQGEGDESEVDENPEEGAELLTLSRKREDTIEWTATDRGIELTDNNIPNENEIDSSVATFNSYVCLKLKDCIFRVINRTR